MNLNEAKAMTEEELEKHLFSTPDSDQTKEEEATSSKEVQEETHTEKEGAVTPETRPVTDEPLTTKPEEDWEKRYKNLRASRDIKLQEAKSQLSSSLETIRILQQKLNEVSDQNAKLLAQIDTTKDIFTPEEREALGDDTVSIVSKASKAMAEAATADIRKQLEEERKLREEQTKKDAVNAKQEAYNIFLHRLGNMVPDWASINDDPGFKTFCHNTYDLDGSLLADSFHTAEHRGDAVAIAKIMIAYNESKVKKEDKLAEHVTPVANGGNSAQANVTKGKQPEIISTAFVNKFYDDLARGLYRGKQKEADEIEAKIDKAVAEGRITVR